MASPLFIAVDLGAGSGRVFLAGVGQGEFLLEEIRRFQYPPKEESGHLRWNFIYIFEEIKTGLREAASCANDLNRPIRSIGVDTWGVDYGLLDASGNLMADPVCYRDDRTRDTMEKVFSLVPRKEIFESTGIQFQPFNTLYQLFSESQAFAQPTKLLLLPDLINYFLTGKAVAEYTNSTTTQMVNAETGEWDLDLLKRLEIPHQLLPDIVSSGTDLGKMKPELADALGLGGVRVVAPGTHDTASAVAAAPISENWAYISSGTWSLIGIERKEPLINEAAERQNFTNEGGVYGTYRCLKNVMGLWIFESCRKEWQTSGVDVEYDAILNDINNITDFNAFIFPDDERFLNPPSMITAIRQQLAETGQQFDPEPSAVSKVIFDSLAFRYSSIMQSIESLTSTKLEGIQILGGGGRNVYLNQMTANASGMRTLAGLFEATVVGNVVVQAISSGRFASLPAARQHVLENFEFQEFVPQVLPQIKDAEIRYAAIEKRFLN